MLRFQIYGLRYGLTAQLLRTAAWLFRAPDQGPA